MLIAFEYSTYIQYKRYTPMTTKGIEGYKGGRCASRRGFKYGKSSNINL